MIQKQNRNNIVFYKTSHITNNIAYFPISIVCTFTW